MLDESFLPQNMDKSQKAALKKAYTETAKAINEKILELQDYLEETGNHSEAYADIQESGGLLPTKAPSTIQEMLDELTRGQLFEQSETSTPAGVEQFYNDFASQFEADENGDYKEGEYFEESPQIDLNKKWVYLDRIKQYNPKIIAEFGGVSETLDEIEKAMISGANMDEWIIDIFNSYESDIESFRQKYHKEKYNL